MKKFKKAVDNNKNKILKVAKNQENQINQKMKMSSL